jgi:lipopolysaccharide biosynthesis regulator YciM
MRQRTALIFGVLFLFVIAIVRAVEENVELLKQPFSIFGAKMNVATALVLSLSIGFLVFSFIVLTLGLGKILGIWLAKFKERAAREAETKYLKGMDAVLGARPLEAVKHFKEAIALNPHSLPALIKLGDTLRGIGKVDEAVSWHTKALTEDRKHLQALYAIVEDYVTKGNNEEGKRWLLEIISIQPKRALHALRLLRNLYIREQNWYKAKEVQGKILKANVLEEERKSDEEYSAAIDYQIFSSLLDRKRLDEAILGLVAIKKDFPSFLPAYVRLAEAYLLAGDEETALLNYRECYSKSGSIVPLLFMEKLLMEKGEPEKAMEEYESAISISPKKVLPKFLLARLYLKLGFFQKAESLFTEVESLSAPTPTIEFYLARINERREEYLRACSHYNEMKRLTKPMEMAFKCKSCGEESSIWTDYCGKCEKWSTYYADIEEEIKKEELPAEPAYYRESAWQENP